MTHLRTDDLGSSPEVSPSELDRLRETVTALTEALTERAEHWEADAKDAEFAGNSYRGKDEEAAIDLSRQAARSRSRALELRGVLEAARLCPQTDVSGGEA